MKPIAFVPPAAALIISGVWLGVQQRSIALLDKQSLLLETHIANARATNQSEETASTPIPGTSSGTAKKAIDWKKVAAQLSDLNQSNGIGGMRAHTKLQEQIAAMSEQELLESLDEIADLDLPKESLTALEDLIAAQLMQKAPEAFLTRFLNRLGDERGAINWRLAVAFTTWAKKDQATATAWYDRQIAAGTFDSKSLDGKSRARLRFEGILVRELLSSNPEAAAGRIAELPPEQREEALRYARNLEEVAPAFADLVRKQLRPEDQAKALAEAAPVTRTGDYSKVTDYLNQIAATPAERDACVVETGRRTIEQFSYERDIKQEDLDRMREWTANEAPEMTNRTTSLALVNLLNRDGGMPIDQVADLALHYHESGGGDELLLPLVDHWKAKRNPDVRRKIAEGISDEKIREGILRQLK